MRKQIEESNSIENISFNENLQLLKNKRTDISLLELNQDNIPFNKILNTKFNKEEEQQIKSNQKVNDEKIDTNTDLHFKSNKNMLNYNNNINYKEESNSNSNQEYYDENLHNLNRIEKIENIINLINGNVNFINSELKSIKNSLMKKRKPNYIKQKLNRINQEDKLNKPDNDQEITSQYVLREIEKLKSGNKNIKNDNNKNNENENSNSYKETKNSNFRKDSEDKPALLQIKSFNDLNIDLDSLEEKNKKIPNNNNKKIKSIQDLNDIIEGFKSKQASENSNLNKKKFHKQVTLNDKQEV